MADCGMISSYINDRCRCAACVAKIAEYRATHAHTPTVNPGPVLPRRDAWTATDVTDHQVRSPDEPWRALAACRGMGPAMFYPERGDTRAVRAAEAVCRSCPVRAACRAAGDAEPAGIWGGTSRNVRRRERAA